MDTKFWSQNLKWRDMYEDRHQWEDNTEIYFKEIE
jgi:hypothetical protein